MSEEKKPKPKRFNNFKNWLNERKYIYLIVVVIFAILLMLLKLSSLEVFFGTLSALSIAIVGHLLVIDHQNRQDSKGSEVELSILLKLLIEEMESNLALLKRMDTNRHWIPYDIMKTGVMQISRDKLTKHFLKYPVLLFEIERAYNTYDLINRQLQILFFSEGHGLDAPIYVQSTLPIVEIEVSHTEELLEIVRSSKLFDQQGKEIDELLRDYLPWKSSIQENRDSISLPEKPYDELGDLYIQASQDLNDYEDQLRKFCERLVDSMKVNLGIPDSKLILKANIPDDYKLNPSQKGLILPLLNDAGIHFSVRVILDGKGSVSARRTGLPVACYKKDDTFLVSFWDGKINFKVKPSEEEAKFIEIARFFYSAIIVLFKVNLAIAPELDFEVGLKGRSRKD